MPPRTPEPRTIPRCIAVDGETCRDHTRSSRLEWLLGPFVRAYLNAFGRTRHSLAYCRSLLRGLERHIAEEGCL